MEEENLIGSSQQLTDDGQKYQFMFTNGEEGKTQTDTQSEIELTDMNQTSDQLGTEDNMSPGMDQLGMGESFKMIRYIVDQNKFNEQLKKFNSSQV